MNNKESNFISVVVYLHQKETKAYDFLSAINAVFEENFNKYEIICVSDDANESVLSDVRRFKTEHTKSIISIVKMGFSHGLEAAMNAGVDLAIGDFIFEFDSCYMDYDKELIMEIYKKALEGFDIVAAVPPKRNSKLSSRMFYRIYNRFSESEGKLSTQRFCMISRRAVNRVSSYSRTIPYRKAVYASSGLNIYNYEYKPAENMGLGMKFEDVEKNDTAADALILFTNLAYKVSMFISGLMALFMIVSGCYTIVVYFGQDKPVEGWAPIMGLVSAGFLATFIILTIIIKYLDVFLKLVFKKQKYMISSIEKL